VSAAPGLRHAGVDRPGERPTAPDPARVAAHRDTALFFDCADVDDACACLRRRGVDVADPVVRDYGMKQLYLKDPDGYEICFQHPAERISPVALTDRERG
jgi:hypothetical protein